MRGRVIIGTGNDHNTKRIASKEPHAEVRAGIQTDISELATAVRAKNPKAIQRLKKIVVGVQTIFGLGDRDNLLLEIASNQKIRGILELYNARIRRIKSDSFTETPPVVNVRKQVFDSVIASLLNAPAVDTSKLTGTEAEFMNGFLETPVLGIRKQASTADSIESYEYGLDLQRNLVEFVAKQTVLSDEFFDIVFQIATRFDKLAPEHSESSHCIDMIIPYKQLRALINNPNLLMDVRIDRTLELIATMQNDQPITFQALVNYTNGEYVLRPDVKPEFVRTAERLAAKPNLWKKEMGRIFMSSIIEAVQHLSKLDPEGTFDARIALLKGSVEMGKGFAENRYGLVYTFTSDGNRKRLEEVLAQPSTSEPLAFEIVKILNNGYKDTLWAI
ncbi:MAG: hypothetical protein Q7S22_07580 [Candidatus Micrarchaeota archaeon]|nr:hypothetical protein [Candidatus Micrarchaeota archaeon]